MHYLKCSKCGHFNEIKSEYQVFCQNCDKKMDNNFADWKKGNPEKSFEDFKLLIGTTELNKKPQKESQSKFIGSKSLKYWIAFAVSFAIFYAIGHFAGNAIVGLFSKPSIDKELVAIANELNKSCPLTLDSETRLDNVMAFPDKTIQYTYSLTNMEKSTINVNDLKSYLEPRILNNAKTSPDMQELRDIKTTFKYYYKDKTGSHVLTIDVTPEQYQ